MAILRSIRTKPDQPEQVWRVPVLSGVILLVLLLLGVGCGSESGEKADTPENWEQANRKLLQKSRKPRPSRPGGENRKLLKQLKAGNRAGLLKLLQRGEVFIRHHNLNKALELALTHKDHALFAMLVSDRRALLLRYRNGTRYIFLYLKPSMRTHPVTRLIARTIDAAPGRYKRLYPLLAHFRIRTGEMSAETLETMLRSGLAADAPGSNGDSLMMQALRFRRPELVPVLLRSGANVNYRNRRKQTPIMMAASSGDMKSFRLLALRGADPHAWHLCKKQTGFSGSQQCQVNVAMYAVKGGNLDILKKYFPDASHFSDYRFEPGNDALALAIRTHKPAVLAWLLSRGLDPNRHARDLESAGMVVVKKALKHRYENRQVYYRLFRMLLKSGLKLDRIEPEPDKNVLRVLVSRCELELADFLLNKGLEKQTDVMRSVASKVAWYNRFCPDPSGALKWMQRQGVRPEADMLVAAAVAGKHKLVAWMLTGIRRMNATRVTQTRAAMRQSALIRRLFNEDASAQLVYGRLLSLGLLLRQGMVDINARDKYGRPWVFALAANREKAILNPDVRKSVRTIRFEILSLCLRKGYRLDMRDRHGNQLLHEFAARHPLDAGVLKLIRRFHRRLNTKGASGKRLLHLVMKNRNLDPGFVRSLLTSGARVNSRDDRGETPLHTLLRQRHVSAKTKRQLVSMLLKAGAKVNAENKQGMNSFWIYISHSKPDLDLANVLIRKGANLKAPAASFYDLLAMAGTRSQELQNLVGFYLFHRNRAKGSFNDITANLLRSAVSVRQFRLGKIILLPKQKWINEIQVQSLDRFRTRVRLIMNTERFVAAGMQWREFVFARTGRKETVRIVHDWQTRLGRGEYGKPGRFRFVRKAGNTIASLSTIKSLIGNDADIMLQFEFTLEPGSLPGGRHARGWKTFVFDDGAVFHGPFRQQGRNTFAHGKGLCVQNGRRKSCRYLDGMRVARIRFRSGGAKYLGSGLISHRIFSRGFFPHGRGQLVFAGVGRMQGRWEYNKNFRGRYFVTLPGRRKSYRITTSYINPDSPGGANAVGLCRQRQTGKAVSCHIRKGWLYSGADKPVRMRWPRDRHVSGWYVGKLDNNRAEGYGFWYRDALSHALYAGSWQQNLPQGQGVSVNAEGERYSGSWFQGRRQGVGTCLSGWGRKEVCHFLDDLYVRPLTGSAPVGEKALGFYATAAVFKPDRRLLASYQGSVSGGVPDGDGILFNREHPELFGMMKPGDRLRGRFRHGRITGRGFLFRARRGVTGLPRFYRFVIHGKFTNNRYPSTATVTWADGNRYIGPLQNGLAHGRGKCLKHADSEMAYRVSRGLVPRESGKPVYITCRYHQGYRIRKQAGKKSKSYLERMFNYDSP